MRSSRKVRSIVLPAFVLMIALAAVVVIILGLFIEISPFVMPGLIILISILTLVRVASGVTKLRRGARTLVFAVDMAAILSSAFMILSEFI